MARSNIVSLNALRAFEAAGRLGRMVAAADELNVTHGAISRQIKQLEDVLGVQLFDGPKNRPELTEIGRHMLPMLTSAFDQIDRAVHDVVDAARGVVTVSCPSTLMMRWLIPRLHDFTEAHPEIEVRVVPSDSVSEPNLAAHDIAIRLLTRPIASDARTERAVLFDEAVGPVLSTHLAAHGRFEEPQDLAAVRLLTSQARPESWEVWFGAHGAAGLDYDKSEPYEQFYILYEAVLGGLGAGLLPWQLAGDEIKSGRLVAPFGFDDQGRSHTVLWRRDARPRDRTVVEWLLGEGAKTDPPPEMARDGA